MQLATILRKVAIHITDNVHPERRQDEPDRPQGRHVGLGFGACYLAGNIQRESSLVICEAVRDSDQVLFYQLYLYESYNDRKQV